MFTSTYVRKDTTHPKILLSMKHLYSTSCESSNTLNIDQCDITNYCHMDFHTNLDTTDIAMDQSLILLQHLHLKIPNNVDLNFGRYNV